MRRQAQQPTEKRRRKSNTRCGCAHMPQILRDMPVCQVIYVRVKSDTRICGRRGQLDYTAIYVSSDLGDERALSSQPSVHPVDQSR